MAAIRVNDVGAKFRHFQYNLYWKSGTWDAYFGLFRGENLTKVNLKRPIIVKKLTFYTFLAQNFFGLSYSPIIQEEHTFYRIKKSYP